MPILSRAIRNARAMMRANEWGDSSIPSNSSWLTSRTGGGSEGSALGIGAVLACVKALYDDTVVLPFKAYAGDRFGAHAPIRVQPQIVREPFGPELPPADGLGQLVVSKAMRGNGYCFVVDRDADGFPTQLAVLHPDAVRVRREAGAKVIRVNGEEQDPRDIVHVRGLMLPGSVVGVDVLTYQRTTHELAWSVNEYADGFFRNGGSPSGVINVPGPGDRKRAREVREDWEGAHSGVSNAHRVALMFGGATWQQLSVTPENAQFLETRRFLREEICGLYGVPLQRIQAIVENASQGGGRGLDAIDAGYVKHGLMPTHAPIEHAWSALIPGDQSTWCRFDYDEFLRANAQIRSLVAQQHRVAGVRTIDEIRAKDYGMEPYPDGKGADPFTPLNSNASPIGGADNEPNPGTEVPR